jgi:hypothetical protein
VAGGRGFRKCEYEGVHSRGFVGRNVSMSKATEGRALEAGIRRGGFLMLFNVLRFSCFRVLLRRFSFNIDDFELIFSLL